MKTKQGVILVGLHRMMQIANAKAAVIWSKQGKELVITEGVCYRESGFHPLGRACDYRTRYFDPDGELQLVAKELQDELGKDYDVVIEDDHIHAEYDPLNPKII